MSDWSSVEVVEQLKERSDALYGKWLDDRTREQRRLESGDEYNKFVAEISALLDDLDRMTSHIRLLDDYSWLLNASLQWQTVAAILKMPRKVKIPEAPVRLWAPTQRLGKEDVDQWLASLEMQLCKIRHYQDFVHRVRRVEVEPIDKYNAKVYLCRDILEGAAVTSNETVDFVEKMPPDVYNYLEEVWFRDVLQLEAYLIWEARGAVVDGPEDRRKGDYLDACEKYRRLLADQSIKREPEQFISIRDYINRTYMRGQSQALDDNKRRELVGRKARQLSEYAARPADKQGDWMEAAAYVDGFYISIVPAVVRGDKDASGAVANAILRSEGKESRLSIMNGLEAGICLYFLRGFEYFAEDWKGAPSEE